MTERVLFAVWNGDDGFEQDICKILGMKALRRIWSGKDACLYLWYSHPVFAQVREVDKLVRSTDGMVARLETDLLSGEALFYQYQWINGKYEMAMFGSEEDVDVPLFDLKALFPQADVYGTI